VEAYEPRYRQENNTGERKEIVTVSVPPSDYNSVDLVLADRHTTNDPARGEGPEHSGRDKKNRTDTQGIAIVTERPP